MFLKNIFQYKHINRSHIFNSQYTNFIRELSTNMVSKKNLESLPSRPSLIPSSLPPDPLTPDPQNLPSDHLLRTPRAVLRAAFSYVKPQEAPGAKLLAFSRPALELLDLDEAIAETQEFVDVFSGNKIIKDTQPWACCYGGHQFGYYAGQLGDGRVMSLFDTINSKSERWELQLKGAGKTPYSRFADGNAVLRSSIREFLISENLAALSIPTTRALSLISTTREVYRDDAGPGVPQPERGAIVCRMAPTWLRFGNFQIFYHRGHKEELRKLAEFAIKEVVIVPDEIRRSEGNEWNRFGSMFREVVRRTVKMVAAWQSSGFNHGVMNTDNMSLIGLTLDFGPFAFFDTYNPNFRCNHTDEGGRYSFINQPTACMWNCFQLGISLAELIGAGDDVDTSGPWDTETSKKYFDKGVEMTKKVCSDEFGDWFTCEFVERMRAKLGLLPVDDKDGLENMEKDLDDVIMPLLTWMNAYSVDYIRFFRTLSNFFIAEPESSPRFVSAAIAECVSLTCDKSQATTNLNKVLELYRARLLLQELDTDEARKKRMDTVNPRFVLRNWIAQDIIDNFWKDEEAGKAMLEECLECCLEPFKEKYRTERQERWATERTPEWGEGLVCSCSS